jgi:hypothetical protein
VTRAAEVERILHRYLVEVVERYDLCPWARPARLGGELAIGVVWGTPAPEVWVAEARSLLGRPETRVAMIVAPELAGPPSALRAIRDHVAAHVREAGIAEFHPDAALDLTTPARLVPFLRRAPDPLLQLVPFALLDPVRTPPMPVLDRLHQAQMLGGLCAPPRADIADTIAGANHATVLRHRDEITAALDAIAADRAASYARVAIGRRDP